MPNQALLVAARSTRVRAAVTRFPVTRRVVDRFVAGERLDDAIAAARRLLAAGLMVSIDHLGEDTRTRAQVGTATTAYLQLLARLGAAGFGEKVEVSVKLSALGRALPCDGDRLALDAARTICESARDAGTTVTLDMEDHTTVDSTLSILRALRRDFPWVGVAVQSCLLRSETDCAELAGPGSRVRLVKGAYAEPASVAHRSRTAVDRAYARCLTTLMSGAGYPMVATHDPALVALARRLASRHGREPGSYEYQMLHGVRPDAQRRMAAAGRPGTGPNCCPRPVRSLGPMSLLPAQMRTPVSPGFGVTGRRPGEGLRVRLIRRPRDSEWGGPRSVVHGSRRREFIPHWLRSRATGKVLRTCRCRY